jgi:hypothetical protein
MSPTASNAVGMVNQRAEGDSQLRKAAILLAENGSFSANMAAFGPKKKQKSRLAVTEK